jgi:Tfp pilus assembly protein PilN
MMMFTIDLLKGNGIPLRSSPRRAALRTIPFLLPIILTLGLVVEIFYNRTLLITGQDNLQRMQAQITKARQDVTAYEHMLRTIQDTRNRLREVARVLNRHTQWSDVLTTLAGELPQDIAIGELDLKRSATRKKASDKNNPEKVVTCIQVRRVLEITLYGPPSGRTDQVVEQYLDRLSVSPVVAPMIESIRIASRYEEEIDDHRSAVYKVECLCKSQES